MQKAFRGLGRVCAMVMGIWGFATIAHAQSSVSLYGLVDAFVGDTHMPGSAGSAWQVSSGGMTTSYWGLSGSEDLGRGMKAVFTLESFFRVNSGQIGSFNGQSFFGRNAFVGLSGRFGEVTIGRNTAPLFVSTLLFNPFGNSFAFSPIVAHSYAPTSRRWFRTALVDARLGIRLSTVETHGCLCSVALRLHHRRIVG